MELSVSLNPEEMEAVKRMRSAVGSRQDVIRALIYAASQDIDLEEHVTALAICGERLGSHEAGQQAGLTPEDYERALKSTGSIRQAAKQLGVSRAAVRQARDRHDIKY